MIKNSFRILITQIVLGGVVTGLILGAATLYTTHQARQARFSVDALEQYLQAYRLVEGKSIERLSDLPDFFLVAPSTSLSLKAGDLKQGIKGGYFYDLQYSGNDHFVVSASPAGVFAKYEFGITDKGLLRMNTRGADVEADSYEEVETWPVLTRDEKIRTQDLPEYLK